MLILDTTTKSIEVILAGAITMNQLPFVASYIDVTTNTYTPFSNDGQTNNTTAVTVIASPAASTQRQTKLITVHNADTVAATVTLRLNNNGTFRTICKVILPTLAQLIYTDGEGFRVIDSSGNLLQSNNTINLTSQVTGILPVGNGGTGVASLSNILGTANQVIVTGGIASIIGGNVTLATPQNIATSSTPQFAGLGVNGVAVAGVPLNVYDASNGNGIRLTNSSVNKFWEFYPVSNGGNTDIRLFETGIGDHVTFQAGGNIGIGTTNPATSAIMELASTTGALLVPRMTTTQKNALTPVNGMIVYDTTIPAMQGYVNGAWITL